MNTRWFYMSRTFRFEAMLFWNLSSPLSINYKLLSPIAQLVVLVSTYIGILSQPSLCWVGLCKIAICLRMSWKHQRLVALIASQRNNLKLIGNSRETITLIIFNIRMTVEKKYAFASFFCVFKWNAAVDFTRTLMTSMYASNPKITSFIKTF